MTVRQDRPAMNYGGMTVAAGRMTMRFPRALAAALAAAVLLMAAPAQTQNKTFKVGVVASLSGTFAGPAADSVEGIKAWMKARGVPNTNIVLETLDDETTPVGASNAFRRIAANPDIALIYAIVPSSSVMAIKSLASEFKVPIISAGAADAIGIPADPWLFKITPAVKDFMTVLAQYAKDNGYKRIAMLNGTDAFGQAEIAGMRELAPKLGLEIVAAETYSAEDTNYNAQLARIRAARPDLLYTGAFGRAAILVFQQFKQLGLNIHLVMGQSVVTKSFFDGIGGPKVADGVMVPIQLGSFGPSVGGESAKLYTELEKALGHLPTYFNTFGYDVGLITEIGLTKSDGSRKGIRDALEAIKDLPAVNGPVTYQPEDHTGQNYRSIAIGRLEDGKPVLPKK
jgi:branched-chain amino acid transport system substrate-binding protein